MIEKGIKHDRSFIVCRVMNAKETALHIQTYKSSKTAEYIFLLGDFFSPSSVVIYYFAIVNSNLKSKGHRMGGYS
jgi:hypothetical protein